MEFHGRKGTQRPSPLKLSSLWGPEYLTGSPEERGVSGFTSEFQKVTGSTVQELETYL